MDKESSSWKYTGIYMVLISYIGSYNNENLWRSPPDKQLSQAPAYSHRWYRPHWNIAGWQYASDDIAGVINIILKSKHEPFKHKRYLSLIASSSLYVFIDQLHLPIYAVIIFIPGHAQTIENIMVGILAKRPPDNKKLIIYGSVSV